MDYLKTYDYEKSDYFRKLLLDGVQYSGSF